jgi:hypothetical protein
MVDGLDLLMTKSYFPIKSLCQYVDVIVTVRMKRVIILYLLLRHQEAGLFPSLAAPTLQRCLVA